MNPARNRVYNGLPRRRGSPNLSIVSCDRGTSGPRTQCMPPERSATQALCRITPPGAHRTGGSRLPIFDGVSPCAASSAEQSAGVAGAAHLPSPRQLFFGVFPGRPHGSPRPGASRPRAERARHERDRRSGVDRRNGTGNSGTDYGRVSDSEKIERPHRDRLRQSCCASSAWPETAHWRRDAATTRRFPPFPGPPRRS